MTKSIKSFQANQNRWQKQLIQFTFARGHREKQLKAGTFLALRWYVNRRRCKKMVYEKAKLDRKKV